MNQHDGDSDRTKIDSADRFGCSQRSNELLENIRLHFVPILSRQRLLDGPDPRSLHPHGMGVPRSPAPGRYW